MVRTLSFSNVLSLLKSAISPSVKPKIEENSSRIKNIRKVFLINNFSCFSSRIFLLGFANYFFFQYLNLFNFVLRAKSRDPTKKETSLFHLKIMTETSILAITISKIFDRN